MIYNMWDGHNKMNSRCIHYKNSSTGWQQYESFSIQHSNGHRHKTPAIARCFTFYTTVSPSRRKYMEERRERVIRLSSDSTSFLQNCMVNYFGEHWCRQANDLGGNVWDFQKPVTVFHRKSRVVTNTDLTEVVALFGGFFLWVNYFSETKKCQLWVV